MLLKGILTPVALGASRAHGAFAAQAPSNRFILILREHPRRLTAVAGAVVAACGCLVASHLLTRGSGGPGLDWLALPSFCLAWDGLKLLVTAVRLLTFRR
jgi:hypothetical protein